MLKGSESSASPAPVDWNSSAGCPPGGLGKWVQEAWETCKFRPQRKSGTSPAMQADALPSKPPGKPQGRPTALAGNWTRVNCLEGSYAHLYTIAKSPNSPVIGSISSLSKRRTNASIYGSKLFQWKKISELYFPLLFTLGRHLRVILSPPYLSSTLISIQSLKPYLIYLWIIFKSVPFTLMSLPWALIISCPNSGLLSSCLCCAVLSCSVMSDSLWPHRL